MPPAASRLIVRTGPNPGMVFDLTKEVTMLGRDVTNDIVVGDAEISRQHSRVTRTPGGMVLEDLGSTNGTFINGDRLGSPRGLVAGGMVGGGGEDGAVACGRAGPGGRGGEEGAGAGGAGGGSPPRSSPRSARSSPDTS